jgi:hypothetical protein
MKSQGASDEFVVSLLRQHGWSEKRAYQTFGAWYESRTGKAVPNGGGRIEAAKDAFLYLLAFITLAIWAFQLGALFFVVIDRSFPNPVIDYQDAAFVIRGIADHLAGVIVAFPLFMFVTRAIVLGVEKQPERLESSVRKWLTYLALVIAASTLIVDIVTFLAYFLRGDLDTRFILKVLTVLIIAGGVFIYYFDPLRREKVSSSRNWLFAAAAFAAVAFGIVIGFIHVGSPATQRVAAEDTRRIADLSSLANGLHDSWLQRGTGAFVLPGSIQKLQPVNSVIDPVTGRYYEYTPLQGASYRLCATFSLPSPPDIVSQWHHGAGKTCFTLDATQGVEVLPRPF